MGKTVSGRTQKEKLKVKKERKERLKKLSVFREWRGSGEKRGTKSLFQRKEERKNRVKEKQNSVQELTIKRINESLGWYGSVD